MAFVDILGRDPLELWLLAGLLVVMLLGVGQRAWRRRQLKRRGGDALLNFPADGGRRPAPAAMGGLLWAPPASEVDDDEPAFVPTARAPAPPPATPPPFRPATGSPVAEFPAGWPVAEPLSPPVAPAPHPVNGNGASAAPAPLPVAPNGSAPAPAFNRPAANGGSPGAVSYPPARGVSPAQLPHRQWSRVTNPSPDPARVDEASETIRLPTAADGTVQLLPGMLVMTKGPDVGREYRFLRVGSQPVPEVTLGRASGPPYLHIQLPAVTVSRMHARIRYEGGSWQVANLSHTNPLRLNGRELPTMTEHPLAEGDLIQLGEVELCYRDGRL